MKWPKPALALVLPGLDKTSKPALRLCTYAHRPLAHAFPVRIFGCRWHIRFNHMIFNIFIWRLASEPKFHWSEPPIPRRDRLNLRTVLSTSLLTPGPEC